MSFIEKEIMIGDVNVTAILNTIIGFVYDVLSKVIPGFDEIMK